MSKIRAPVLVVAWVLMHVACPRALAADASARATPTNTVVSVVGIMPSDCVASHDKVTLNGSGLSAVSAVWLSGTSGRWNARIGEKSDKRLIFSLPLLPPEVLGRSLQIALLSNAGGMPYEVANHVNVCSGSGTLGLRSLEDLESNQGKTVATEERAPEGNRTVSEGERRPETVNRTSDRSLALSTRVIPNSYASAAVTQPEPHQTGELVLFSPSMQQAKDVAEVSAQWGGRVAARVELKQLGYVLTTLRFPVEVNLGEVMRGIRERVDSANPTFNHHFGFEGAPSDDERMMPSRLVAWDRHKGNCAQTPRIGIIDSPIETHHPAIASADIRARSFLPRGVASAPAAHGTAIASILVGRGDVTGLLPSAHLVAAEVFRAAEGKQFATAEDIVRALDWLIEQRVHAINLSFAGPENALVGMAVAQVQKTGVPVIAAVGNDKNCERPAYPAAHPGVIATTAVDVNRRPYVKANCGTYVALAAPGVDVWAAGEYGKARFHSGTSFATPYVTAAAALIAQHEKDVATVSSTLFNRAIDLGEEGRDPIFGFGLLQMPLCAVDAMADSTNRLE